MNFLKQIFKTGEQAEAPARPAEPMTDAKVDFSFGVYWTKMSRLWDATRRMEVRQQVLAVTQSEGFHHNLIEKRYNLPLEDVPEKLHSGASLIALLGVLDALDSMDESEKNSEST